MVCTFLNRKMHSYSIKFSIITKLFLTFAEWRSLELVSEFQEWNKHFAAGTNTVCSVLPQVSVR